VSRPPDRLRWPPGTTVAERVEVYRVLARSAPALLADSLPAEGLRPEAFEDPGPAALEVKEELAVLLDRARRAAGEIGRKRARKFERGLGVLVLLEVEGLTLREAGARLGVSGQRVDQLKAWTIRFLAREAELRYRKGSTLVAGDGARGGSE